MTPNPFLHRISHKQRKDWGTILTLMSFHVALTFSFPDISQAHFDTII